MTDGPVEEFLAELARLLRRDEQQRRRIVSEIRGAPARPRCRGPGPRDSARSKQRPRPSSGFGTPRTLARAVRAYLAGAGESCGP